MPDIEHILNNYSLKLLLFGGILLFALAFISLKAKKLSEKAKEFLFFGIVAATIVPTLFLSFSTIYLNSISASGGPVHWHADFEIWACGKELELEDPKGISNKIGTSTLHEHNDKKIHIEGIVMKPEDASLGNFLRASGGELSATSITVPTDERNRVYRNGDSCPTGATGELQVFVYKTAKSSYYSQEKLSDPQNYILSPYATVPPGDCIIVEFGESKLKTDKLCRSYKVAEEIGKLKGEQDGN